MHLASSSALRRTAALLVAVGVCGLASACGGGGSEEPAADHEGHFPAAEAEGLTAAENGVRLVLDKSSLPAGKQPLSFRILGNDGKPVTEFEVEQERKLHLIVVRRDLTEFQHLHPNLAPNGTWSVNIRFPEPGTYRVFADFIPAGREQTVLGADVPVGGGDFSPEPLPEPQTALRVGGYDIRVDMSEVEEHGEGELALEISRDGRPVTDLQPYLGAFGHAVILREQDLAYLHAHPLAASGAGGGEIKFHVALPTPARYRAFVQFRHENRVHTAAVTIGSQAAS